MPIWDMLKGKMAAMPYQIEGPLKTAMFFVNYHIVLQKPAGIFHFLKARKERKMKELLFHELTIKFIFMYFI